MGGKLWSLIIQWLQITNTNNLLDVNCSVSEEKLKPQRAVSETRRSDRQFCVFNPELFWSLHCDILCRAGQHNRLIKLSVHLLAAHGPGNASFTGFYRRKKLFLQKTKLMEQHVVVEEVGVVAAGCVVKTWMLVIHFWLVVGYEFLYIFIKFSKNVIQSHGAVIKR